METEHQKELSLKVLEAYTRDVGRGVCRIDYDSMDKLDLVTGGIVKLTNKQNNKFTVAKVLPLYPSDEGKSMIRIDGFVRRNAGYSKSDLGSEAKIEKVKASPAEKVVVVALEAIPPIDERYLADGLESVPIVLEDQVAVPYFGGRLEFQVKEIIPEGYCIITQKTIFEIVESNDGVKYSEIGKAFKEREIILKKELAELLDKPFTDSLANEILKINNEINKIQSVRTIAFKVLREKKNNEVKK